MEKIYNKKINIWINWNAIYNNSLPLFLSIAKTFNKNWFKVFFLNPNLIQKYQLKKYWINFINWNYKKIINDNNIKKIIILNWSYNDINIKWVQKYYFENWYFWNDLQIFNSWVNAKSEICALKYENFLKNKKEIIIKVKKITVIKDLQFNLYNYWILWFFSNNIIKSFRNFSFILKSIFENIKKNKILKNEKIINLKKWKYIIIWFQVFNDTQIIFNSHIIDKMENILDFYYKDIKKILPDYKIIIKEHPVDIWKNLYANLQKKYKDVIWIKKWNIYDFIEKSDYLICVNSSIWLQALSKYKKVLTLWENFYSNNPWVKNINNKNDFKNKLLELKNQNIKKDKFKIDNYISHFKKNIFISNWWFDNFTEKTIKDICEKILN